MNSFRLVVYFSNVRWWVEYLSIRVLWIMVSFRWVLGLFIGMCVFFVSDIMVKVMFVSSRLG